MAWLFALAVLLVVIAAAPLFLEKRRTQIGVAQRHGAKGAFAQLSQGVTHYKWIGPVRGPVAVAIHGLSTPSIAWETVAAGLGELGYRVLVYDLYGRGLSDAPPGRQNRAFFIRQLSDLLADQNVGNDITIVGYSMGGSIATAFASENPHRTDRVILVAPAGIIANESPFSKFCRETPIIGDWVHGVIGGRRILASTIGETKTLLARRVQAAQQKELSRRGFLPAILSSRRGILAEVQEAEHRKLGKDNIPVIAIWGQEDSVVPVGASSKLALWNGGARQVIVKGADHALPYSHGEDVVKALRHALRG